MPPSAPAETVREWIDVSGAAARDIAQRSISRFSSLRGLLRPVEGVSLSASTDEILAHREELHGLASGRSKTATDMHAKKRIAYAIRLAQGERAFRRLLAGHSIEVNDVDFREGVRAVHDLVLPSVHMEVTVCGAVPPFSALLGGKLVAAFTAHPDVLTSVLRSERLILHDVFESGAAGLLPSHGLLALTTKGLYPGHSALYNRAAVPGVGPAGQVPIRKIGETEGTTASLFTNRTSKLAQRLHDFDVESPQVSRAYGTGGAKRQRMIEAAVTTLGLPPSLAKAGIRRPVYSVVAVNNIPDVIWSGREPDWAVPRNATPSQYSDMAAELWRNRWLAKAQTRAASLPVSLTSVMELLED